MLKLKTHLDVLTLGVNREKKMFFFFHREDSPTGRSNEVAPLVKCYNLLRLS